MLERNKAYRVYDSSGEIELVIKGDDLLNIAQSGDNAPAVEECLNSRSVRKQLEKLSDDVINKAFDYVGFDMTDEEARQLTRDDKLEYIIWNIAWDIADGGQQPEEITDEQINNLGESVRAMKTAEKHAKWHNIRRNKMSNDSIAEQLLRESFEEPSAEDSNAQENNSEENNSGESVTPDNGLENASSEVSEAFKPEEGVRKENGKIICTCYGDDKEFDSIASAKNYFEQAYFSCDPKSSEASRYADVLCQLLDLESTPDSVAESLLNEISDKPVENTTTERAKNYVNAKLKGGDVENARKKMKNNMELVGKRNARKYENYEELSDEAKAIVDNYDPEAIKVEPYDSSLGWSVLVKDKNSNFQAWVDVSVDEKYQDVSTEWNQYIFYTDDSSDVLQQELQDNDMIFDYCTSEAIQKLQAEGLIDQDDQAHWFYTDKAKEEARERGINESVLTESNKAQKLIDSVKKKIANSEYRTVTMNGVKNLSRADLEEIIMYAEQIRDKGSYDGFMQPRGGVGEVLKKAGLIESLKPQITEEDLGDLLSMNGDRFTDIKDLDLPEPLGAGIPTTEDGEAITIEALYNVMLELKSAITDLATAVKQPKVELQPLENPMGKEPPVEEAPIEEEPIGEITEPEEKTDKKEPKKDDKEDKKGKKNDKKDDNISDEELDKEIEEDKLKEDLNTAKTAIDNAIEQKKSPEELDAIASYTTDGDGEKKQADEYKVQKMKEALKSTVNDSLLSRLKWGK